LPGSATALLTQYLFGSDPVPASSIALHLTAGDLTLVGAPVATANALFYNANSSDWPQGSLGSVYYEVTLDIDPGYILDFTAVTLDYVVGSNPTFTTALKSSVDGYVGALSSHVDAPGISNYSDSLADLGTQSGSITFRIYGEVDSASGTAGLYGGSLSFLGPGPTLAATPEPSTFALFAGGGLLLGLARKRKKTA